MKKFDAGEICGILVPTIKYGDEGELRLLSETLQPHRAPEPVSEEIFTLSVVEGPRKVGNIYKVIFISVKAKS